MCLFLSHNLDFILDSWYDFLLILVTERCGMKKLLLALALVVVVISLGGVSRALAAEPVTDTFTWDTTWYCSHFYGHSTLTIIGNNGDNNQVFQSSGELHVEDICTGQSYSTYWSDHGNVVMKNGSLKVANEHDFSVGGGHIVRVTHIWVNGEIKVRKVMIDHKLVPLFP